jgi:Holliday junction resolvase RusA-like endonuclease
MVIEYYFEIHGRVIGYNQYMAMERFKRAKTKKAIEKNLKAQMPLSITQQVLAGPADVHIHWIESNRRRDPDNIASATKFIFDALQAVGFLPNDNHNYIRSLHHTFEIGEEAGIQVTICSCK